MPPLRQFDVAVQDRRPRKASVFDRERLVGGIQRPLRGSSLRTETLLRGRRALPDGGEGANATPVMRVRATSPAIPGPGRFSTTRGRAPGLGILTADVTHTSAGGNITPVPAPFGLSGPPAILASSLTLTEDRRETLRYTNLVVRHPVVHRLTRLIEAGLTGQAPASSDEADRVPALEDQGLTLTRPGCD